jgi:hypothetical protein
MTQAHPSRSALVLFSLLGGVALGAAALAALGQPWWRTGRCRPASAPGVQAGVLEPDEEDASRVAFV